MTFSAPSSSNAIQVVKLGDDNFVLAKVAQNLPEGDYRILVSIQSTEEGSATAGVVASQSAFDIDVCCDGLRIRT